VKLKTAGRSGGSAGTCPGDFPPHPAAVSAAVPQITIRPSNNRRSASLNARRRIHCHYSIVGSWRGPATSHPRRPARLGPVLTRLRDKSPLIGRSVAGCPSIHIRKCRPSRTQATLSLDLPGLVAPPSLLNAVAEQCSAPGTETVPQFTINLMKTSTMRK